MGTMGQNKMGKMRPMMGMHPMVVATSDGGVVILTGKRLVKYDNALNLVKEVELKGGPKPEDKKAEAAVQTPSEPAPAPSASGSDAQQ